MLRCVEAGQTINGLRYLPSAEIHSIAVTKSPLDSGPSAIPEILFTHQNFERAQNTQQNARLVHVIDILRNNGRVVELLAYQCKPLQNFIVNIVIMSCPVQRFDSFRLELGMTFVEALWPILAWRSNITVNGRNLESGATLTCDHECEGTQELDR